MQKRLENKDRFRTQTLSESSFSPEISSASPPLTNGEAELHLRLQKEADLVLRTLRDAKSAVQDEMLDCETVSLVSNDEDSEHNSGCSVNYRTYHKSWGFKKNVPVIEPEGNREEDLANCRQPNFANDLEDSVENSEHSEGEEEPKPAVKPKIVKPDEKVQETTENIAEQEQAKGIRGRRKPLYSKSNLSNVAPKSIKPTKTVTSNLVKNVTSSLKSGTALKSVTAKQNKTTTVKAQVTQSKVSSGYGSRNVSNSNSPKTSPARVPANRNIPKSTPTASKQTPTPKGEYT